MSMRLHHVALATPKAEESVNFYSADWGLRETGRDGGEVRLAASLDGDDDYSLVIKPAAQKFVDHFCLVSDDAPALVQLHDRLRADGVTVLDDAPTCPGIESAFQIIDIDGRRLEIGFRAMGDSSRVAGSEERDAVPLKPGHIVLNTPDIQAATSWYEQKLGFGVREWRTQKMSFLYCNEDHHTVAFNNAPHASLNHVAWELPNIDEFFRAVGRASGTQTGEKLYGPGRHGPGDYVFCYFLDPTGLICEYETDGIKIADPADFEFRVLEYSPQSADQWLGTLSGGMPQRFRKCAIGEPDAGLVSASGG